MLSQMEGRVNFLLTSVSGIAAVLAFVSQMKSAASSFSVHCFITNFHVVFTWINRFCRVWLRDILVLYFIQEGLDRIRRFFVDADSRIKDYMLLPVTDNVPRFGGRGFSSTPN